MTSNGGADYSPRLKHFPCLPTSIRPPTPFNISFLGVWSAFLFGISSLSLVSVNKIILTSYSFPSPLCLALGQMVASICVLNVARLFGFLTLPVLSRDNIVQVQPVPVLYLLNAVTGLTSTQLLPLPMFTVLRRFSILFTMVGEYLLLSQTVTKPVILSVLLMVLGAIVAASADLTFDLYAYVMINTNNIFTASLNVVGKFKTANKKFGEYGLVYLNSVLMLIPLSLFTQFRGEFNLAYNYTEWKDLIFVAYFISSCLMGFLLNYSAMLCSRVNSALTTTVIGTMKNVIITYFGMVFWGDYLYSNLNFIGISISVLSGVMYSIFKFVNW